MANLLAQNQRRHARRQHGFTLLELVVVLTLMALAVGLVAPNVMRWLANAQERAWRSDLRAALLALPVRAYLKGQVLEVDQAYLRKSVPLLPADLVIGLDQPLHYAANGTAGAGTIRLRRPGTAEEIWRIEPLTGAPVPQTSP